jgi:hypothetical protein
MLEIFDFFRVALAPALWSPQNLLKKKEVSASQLGTSEIRAGMGPATLRSWMATWCMCFQRKLFINEGYFEIFVYLE